MRLLTILLGLILFGIGYAKEFNIAQTQEIQTIVHDYLLAHPTVLVEVSNQLQQQEAVKEQTKILAQLPKHVQELFRGDKPILGNPKGSVVIAEFLNYQCGHCKSTSIMMQQVLKAHPEIKVIVMLWPMLGEDSIYAAKVALAAKKQQRFASMHQAFIASTEVINHATTDKLIKQVGLHEHELQADLKDSALDKELRANFELARKLEILGTPVFIIANQELTKFRVIPGNTKRFINDLKNAIAAVK